MPLQGGQEEVGRTHDCLVVRHISLEIIQCRKLLVCFGFYVLFIRLFVGVPLSLRDINQILSVNIKESLLSYCQQGLRRSDQSNLQGQLLLHS